MSQIRCQLKLFAVVKAIQLDRGKPVMQNLLIRFVIECKFDAINFLVGYFGVVRPRLFLVEDELDSSLDFRAFRVVKQQFELLVGADVIIIQTNQYP